MHLSMLTDSFLSDSLQDCHEEPRDAVLFGRGHRDGLIRGMAFIGCLTLLVATVFGAIHLQAAAIEVARAARAFSGG